MSRKQLVVEYLNGTTRYYPIPPTGWSTDITDTCVIVGKGVGGYRIPLCNVAAYVVDQIPDQEPVNLTERADDTVRRFAKDLNDIDQLLIGVGIDQRGYFGVMALAHRYKRAANQLTLIHELMAKWDDTMPIKELRQLFDDFREGHTTERSSPLDDARLLLAEAAKLFAHAINEQADTSDHALDAYVADINRWLEIHEAYFAGAPLPRDPAGLTTPCLRDCGDDSVHDAHVKLDAAEYPCAVCGQPSDPINEPEPTFSLGPDGRPKLDQPMRMDPQTGAVCFHPKTMAHEDADPGRPADMMPRCGRVSPEDPEVHCTAEADHDQIPDEEGFRWDHAAPDSGGYWNDESLPTKATGGFIPAGAPVLIDGNVDGCVLDVQDPSRAAPINSAYASDLDQERYNRGFLHHA